MLGIARYVQLCLALHSFGSVSMLALMHMHLYNEVLASFNMHNQVAHALGSCSGISVGVGPGRIRLDQSSEVV